MGHRCTYAILEGDTLELFYSHWGALSVPDDLFWGPDYCEAFIRSNERVDGWLDDVWGEGGIGLDKDARSAVYYGGDTLGSGPIADLFDELAASLWRARGWSLARVGDMPDVAEALGQPRAVAEAVPIDPWAANLDDFGTAWNEDRTCFGIVWTGTEHRGIDVAAAPLVTAGPAALDYLHRLPTLDEVIAHYEARPLEAWEAEAGRKAPLTNHLGQAVAYDHARRRIDVIAGWFRDHDIAYNMQHVWPGWTIERHETSLAAHFERLGLEVPPQLAEPPWWGHEDDPDEDTPEPTEDDLLEEIGRHLLGERHDPTAFMQQVIDSMASEGHENVWINPHATVPVPDGRPDPTRCTQLFGEAVAALLRAREGA